MTIDVGSSWEALLKGARRDEQEALGRLLERYRAYLALLVRLQLDERVRTKVSESDIVQQSFFEAVRDFSSYHGVTEADLTKWLRVIVARNLADVVRKYCQTKRRDIQLERRIQGGLDQSSMQLDHALMSRVPSPSQQASQRERALILADALSQLPRSYREVVIRRHFEGKSFPEIARELGGTLDSVKNVWFRAFDQLRRLLKDIK